MPIIIKDVIWDQSERTVMLKIPSRGVASSKIDIFYSKGYIKVSYDQFFFELLPNQEIDVIQSKCTFTPSHIIFELVKNVEEMWEKLEREVDNKTDKMKLKFQYIEEELQRLRVEKAKKAEKKSELKRVAVREQIGLDTKQREDLEELKKSEKNKALEDLDLIKSKKIKPLPLPTPTVEKSLPTVRTAPAAVFVDFTPREFPTPSRESRLEEETEWLRKQSEARRSVGFVSENIRPEERNPEYLKSKGDEFMKNGNYLGAISAYTFGIKLNGNYADLYVARSQAHYARGNYSKCAQDCSTALDLMQPQVPQNLKERASCIGHRGISLIRLGITSQGLDELRASLKLVANEEFQKHLNETQSKLISQ